MACQWVEACKNKLETNAGQHLFCSATAEDRLS